MWYLWVCVIFFLYYVYIRLSCGITRSSTCLLGKTAIITGANSGIGYHTTLNLASRGCRIIMADIADMENSKLNIIKFTNNNNIVTKHLDLTSIQSVRKFASDIIESESKLHILINNAGIGACEKDQTEDGIHPVMQVHHFGHFLLTHLLVDLLKKSAPSRIVFANSILAFTNNLNLENLKSGVRACGVFSTWFNYGNAKLAQMIAADVFGKKLQGTGVTSNTIHPGDVATPIFQKTFSFNKRHILVKIGFVMYNFFFAKDAWEGSQTLVHVAVSKKLENVTGKHFWDCKPFFKPSKANDTEFCTKIWTASEEYVGLREEEKI